MHRAFANLMTVLTGALALGCGDPPRLTAPTDPSLSATVDHSTLPSGFAFFDASRSVFIGFTIEDVIGLCAGNGFTNNEVNQLLVLRPDGSVKFLQRERDMDVVVFETPILSCPDLLAAPRFTGTGRLTATDGDLLLSGNRADASMVQLTGTVTDETGHRFHLVAIGHQVLAPGSTLEDLVFLTTVTNIDVTPIGSF
jgi:hypothetical protein